MTQRGIEPRSSPWKGDVLAVIRLGLISCEGQIRTDIEHINSMRHYHYDTSHQVPGLGSAPRQEHPKCSVLLLHHPGLKAHRVNRTLIRWLQINCITIILCGQPSQLKRQPPSRGSGIRTHDLWLMRPTRTARLLYSPSLSTLYHSELSSYSAISSITSELS